VGGEKENSEEGGPRGAEGVEMKESKAARESEESGGGIGERGSQKRRRESRNWEPFSPRHRLEKELSTRDCMYRLYKESSFRNFIVLISIPYL
jgi:hypothetical protein